MPNTVLITGCSSGIGKATANLFADKGWNVVATMRNTECDAGKEFSKRSNVLVATLDVIDRSSIDSAVASAIEKFGSLDVVINSAGYVLYGPAEFTKKEQAMAHFETNIYGALAVIQAALPHFRSKKAGLIVKVGSLFGRTVVAPFYPLHCASKYALEGLTEALNLELVPLGIRVKIVDPGWTNTDYISRVVKADSGDDTTYDEAVKRSRGEFDNVFGPLPSSAEHIASVLYEAVTDGTKKVRYIAGNNAIKLIEERQSMTDEEWEQAMIRKFNLDKQFVAAN